MKRQILSITRKELSSYFGSPLALIFLGTFLAAVLFIFFTVSTFFARGIADVRPLFQWMPILLIFLLAALTMRQWSEEQRSGTQELLLTLPVNPLHLVLGKFLAVMTMIVLALALTLPLPLTVGLIGNLDWGPVLGGYLAALLMAGAYAAIGLFVSSRTDNQIVALIVTVLLGGLFYLVGTSGVTNLVGGGVSQILWAVGTGSRFESIERGVIDLRDLVYYLSLAGLFLTLNTVSLDAVRWSQQQRDYRRKVWLTAGLLGLNFVLLNVWLFPLQGLRLDLTAQREYSLSRTTKDLIDNLQEPLLIRAYISDKTHPLLAPLVPEIRDMLREYEIASGGQLQAEVVDPLQDPEIEAEANQVYGIRPTPFQVSGRYEASVINSYFDILIRYGDQNVVLNFQDLVEVQPRADGTADVRLRNLEYDLTSGIKKVVYGFQSIDAVLAALDQPVRLTLYVTPNTLPASLSSTQDTIIQVATDIQNSANGKFLFSVVNPDDPNSPVTRQTLQDRYGIQPIPVSLFSSDSFYEHMVLENGDQVQIISPSVDATEADVRIAIESTLKRTSSGFLKVVGLWTPPDTPVTDPVLGNTLQPIASYDLLRQQLSQSYTVRDVDLSTGQVATDVDVLLLMAPQSLDDKALFAIDQYLMRGGAVVVVTGGYSVMYDQFSQQLALAPMANGVRDLLAGYGVNVSDSLLLDAQNAQFPVTVARNVGGIQVQEIQAIDYPFFVDVRADGLDTKSPIAANLPALTLSWASPVELDENINTNRQTAILAHSSDNAWLTTDTNIQPNFDQYPATGFPVSGEPQSYPLAVSVQGVFDSYFKDKPSPFQQGDSGDAAQPTPTAPGSEPLGTITLSPESARLVVIGSPSFADDFLLNLSSRLSGERYLNSLQFLQNSVDWSAEDLDLLAIRSRGTSTRLLNPLTEQQQSVWEIGNYVVALLALIAVYYGWRVRSRREEPIVLTPPPTIETGD
ncbi:MAG: Gldg family protein [Anaerolineales bacterium]|nr:Gldg family protein [Anaerolineales bacterium]